MRESRTARLVVQQTACTEARPNRSLPGQKHIEGLLQLLLFPLGSSRHELVKVNCASH